MSKTKQKGDNSIKVIARQQQLISLLGSGLPIEQIASRLKCTKETIYKDKQIIAQKGLSDLYTLGSANLAFYFQTIISSMNDTKRYLKSVLEMDHKDQKNALTIRDKIAACKGLIECDNSLRETYSKAVDIIVMSDYRKRLDKVESILKEELTQQEELENNDNVKSYMNIKLPSKSNKDNEDNKDNSNNDSLTR